MNVLTSSYEYEYACEKFSSQAVEKKYAKVISFWINV